MNRQLHRLVFSRRHGMLMAVAEHARSVGRAAGGARRRTGASLHCAVGMPLLAAAATLGVAAPQASAQTRPAVVFAGKLAAPTSNLPVPYGSTRLPDGSRVNATPRAFVYDPAQGSSSTDLSASGRVGWSVDGNSATFDQGKLARVILNWDSFNIGAGYKVHFVQDKDPAKYVSALNRIWSADPSLILGALTADREVILLNANGVYFGRGARVDTGKFVATSLSIADSVFNKGLRNVTDGSSVFSTAGTDYLPTNLDSAVTVEAGAEIRSAAGGDVLLFAPRVANQGRIETPAGQTVLAAGDKVYLMSSSDPKQRGLIVAVDPVMVATTNTANSADTELGSVENAATGSYKTVNDATVADNTPDATSGLVTRLNQIRAESGTVNLVGMTVRQKGTINASTAVKGANGAIYLQAMASTAALAAGSASVYGSAGARGLTVEPSSRVRVGADLGTVEIGAGSRTAVTPDSSPKTQIDAEVFNPSLIRVEGKTIHVGAGATLEAPAGKIELLAAANSIANPLFDSTVPNIAPAGDGSRIVIAPQSRISAAGLADVPVAGARNQGSQRLFRIELADAPLQRGGPLYRRQVYFDLRNGAKITAANVTGASAAITRTADERSTQGGSVRIESEGAVVLGQGASVDVSGGSVDYAKTALQNSLAVRNGRVMAFSTAGAGNTIDDLLAIVQRTVIPAYTEGRDGGQLTINGRQVALDGSIQGQVVQGERQRDGSSPRSARANFNLGRGFGSLNYIPGIRLDPANPPPIDAAFFADPLAASLDAVPFITGLSLAKLGQAGFGTVSLRADAISQPLFGALDLGVGGVLDMQAAKTISLNGAFRAPGGRIGLLTLSASANSALTGEGDIRLSGATQLDVAGLWTNDTAAAAIGKPASTAPVQVNAGTINVQAANALAVEAGASLNVSGGAWLAGSGSLKKGTAGSITLATGVQDPTAAGLSLHGAWLSAFDFGAGGTLTLGVPTLTIGAGSGFTLAPEFFSSGGFGSFTVNADGDVHVATGTRLAPSLLNWQLAASYRSAPSGVMSPAAATAAPLDPRLAERQSVNLSLNAKRDLFFGGASVVVDRGAAIELEPGGALTLAATRNIEVGASGGLAGQTSELTARGGRIELAINGVRGSDNEPARDSTGFLGDQAIWLGDGARLSVAGIAKLRPDGSPVLMTVGGASGNTTPLNQRVTGTVLGGGGITLAARRGYVVAAAGSTMALDGASAQVNLPGLAAPVLLAKPGGTLSVSTPEGFALDGSVSARAPVDATGRALADGGQLSLQVALGGNQTGTTGPRKYLDDPANTNPKPSTVLVGNYNGLLSARGTALGQDLSATLDNGIGFVRAAMLADAGFGRLALAAGDSIRFDSSLALNLPLGIQLNAPAIAAAPGAQVSLSSAYAQLGDAFLGRIGNRVPDRAAHADTSASGSTRLSVTAPTIELYGTWGLQGFSNVLLDAGGAPNGEIRFSTVPSNLQSEALGFSGRIDLTAGQVYATSGSLYALNGLAATAPSDPGSTLVVHTGSAGAAALPPLSAFGALAVSATHIEQRGVLRQPFGNIALTAERDLTLGDNSITSVSGRGSTVSYGETVNLSQWTLPYGAVATGSPRDKGVSLSGNKLSTSATASVNASGGGTLQAWEFFPGVGGSKDYFDTPGLYAVLPDYAATQALALNGGKLDAAQQGKQIVITMAGSGLAPGTYTLLPARYALIGGALPQAAFLVSRAADQGRTVLTTPVRQDDGSVIVSGTLSQAGSVNAGTPGERFVVEPQATYLAKSDIRLSDVSTLLANRAATLGAPVVPVLARDAGQVQVTVSGSDKTIWRAGVDLRAEGGLAGLLDLSATRLALVDDLAKTPDGALGVDSVVVAQSGAGSVLLGGRRSLAASSADAAAPTWNIDQSATSVVTVDIGSQTLQVEELLLAGRDNVSLAPGTHLGATPSATLGARTLATVGDGVMVAISANPLELVRTGATLTGGNLGVGAASLLGGRQVGLDASGSLQIDPTVGLQAQALNLGARRIVVGNGAAPDASASVFSGALLSALRGTRDLHLLSYQSIDFVGQQNWSQRPAGTASQTQPPPTIIGSRLVLDAPVVRGLNAADGTPAYTDIAAESVLLRNTTGRVADGALVGQGDLALQALPPLQYGSTGGLALGPGNLTLAFDKVALRSTGDIVLREQGATSAQQDLTLSAARLTATSGAQQSVAAAGQLLVARESASRTLGERVGQGAAVQLSASSVRQQGVIDLPGGDFSIQAQGVDSASAAIRFGAGSVTSVAGFALSGPDGFEAFGRAGRLSASAAQGPIEVFGTLDASAARRPDGSAGAGDAGRVALNAAGAGGQLVLSQLQADGSSANGSLLARAGSGAADLGGSLLVDIGSLASADTLAARAASGGMTREFALRVRTGDVALDSSVKAQRITLAADAGALVLGATTLDAASNSGGVVQLAAGGDLLLGDLTHIDARSLRAGANGGDVLLASTAGRVRLAAGALVDTGGDDAADGRIVLRAQRGADNTSVKVDALATSRLLGGEVDIEALRSYRTVTVNGTTRNIASIAAGNNTIVGGGSTSTGTLGQTAVRNDSVAFMNAKTRVLGALGVGAADSGRVNLRAGVEVLASGNLTVGSDWQLATDRPGGDAGFLTLRAAGNLAVNGSISDGFGSTTSAGVLNNNTRSWSYRLAAGADLAAANPLAVKDFSAAPSATGNLTLAGGRMVRTGAGSIELAAGRDIVFAAGTGSTPQGMAYVAGRKAANQADLLANLFSGHSAKPTFTEQGGRLDLQAKRDITSPEATQLVNNWLWRSGIPSGDQYANSSQLAWWTEFSRFQQTLGSFGGGNLTLNAGRDVVNVQAMVPSAAWADSKVIANARLQVRNGGDLSVTAGHDLLGGQYLVGRGAGHLRAEGGVAPAMSNTRAGSTLLALMDGSWDVAARGDVSIGSAFDPSAIPVSSSDNRATLSSYFYTWDQNAALNLNATAGKVGLYSDLTEGSRIQQYGLSTAQLQSAKSLLQVLPTSLRITAASGDVELFRNGSGGALLFPSAQGALVVWAGGNLTQQNSLAMADTAPALWPDFSTPMTRQNSGMLAGTGTNGLIPGTLANTLAGTSLHATDTEPVQVHADGSIQTIAGSLILPKATGISAGEDILGLALSGQNQRATDTTSIRAGRNLLAGQLGTIALAGPGSLDITAGRQVDLENSGGITTTGNVRNATLPAQGASVKLAAATSGVLDIAAFDATYLRSAAAGGGTRSQQYRDMLLAGVRAALVQPDLSYEQAWAYFKTFPAKAQAEFGRQVLAAEFGAVYLSGPAPSVAQMNESLRLAFELHKAQVLQAGDNALAAGQDLALPGREVLQGAAISAYLGELRALAFTSLDLNSTVASRVASLAKVQSGWRDAVAASLGGTVAGFDDLVRQNPQAAALLAYQAALRDFSGRRFEAYRDQVLASETASAGTAAAQFGRKSLPMRLALFDQGFRAAELAGAGSFVAHPIWPGVASVFGYTGSLDMTQSSVVTQRGGDISLVNAGGAINVGLKQNTSGGTSSATGVIALGDGNVFGYAKSDFQVNTQRVFVVGRGDMNIWSSSGDIDSGRGANTAVAAPPLMARRSVDGVVFELPATTTGSGLGILEDAAGIRSGTIGLYPAFGEILALDAFIRAPSVVLGSSIKGADNLQAAAVGGAAASVSAPLLAVAPPPSSTENRNAETQTRLQSQQERTRNSLLTVDLLGLGPAPSEEECSEQDQRDKKCVKAANTCSDADKTSGQCK